MGLIYLLLTPAVLKVIAAVIPAAYLLKYVYDSDKLEKEPQSLLKALVVAGIFSTAIAMLLEYVGEGQLNASGLDPQSTKYNVILYFGIVGVAEEGAKYIMLRVKTWRSSEFNCQYDATVYAVFISLGFALWENITYVFTYGISVAFVRAVTAIPGHACFGVFMGLWYGAARHMANEGKHVAAFVCNLMALVLPMLIHGMYDYIATMGSTSVFFIFIAIMFYASFRIVKRGSEHDRPI